jgi:hypothetical protein
MINDIKKKKKEKKYKKDKNEKKNKKDKKMYKTKLTVDSEVQKNAIYKSIKQNYIFYIVLIGCIYALTKYNQSSFILGGISIVFITLYGYIMHYLSHFLNTTLSDIYKGYDNIFTRNKYINWMITNYIYFMEFHATTHHDTDINKQYKNIALEFINNAATQGVILIIIKYLLGWIDNRVIILWAFFYATVHNMNYLLVKPSTHKEHHLDDQTNYGIDIWDIIIGSKYDWTNIETHNHTAINLIVITAIIIYLSKKLNL